MGKTRHFARQRTKTRPEKGQQESSSGKVSYLKQNKPASSALHHAPHEPAEPPPRWLLRKRRKEMRTTADSSRNASTCTARSQAQDVSAVAQHVAEATQEGWRIVCLGDSVFEVNDTIGAESQLPSWLFHPSLASEHEVQDNPMPLFNSEHSTAGYLQTAATNSQGDKTPPLSEWQHYNPLRRAMTDQKRKCILFCFSLELFQFILYCCSCAIFMFARVRDKERELQRQTESQIRRLSCKIGMTAFGHLSNTDPMMTNSARHSSNCSLIMFYRHKVARLLTVQSNCAAASKFKHNSTIGVAKPTKDKR